MNGGQKREEHWPLPKTVQKRPQSRQQCPGQQLDEPDLIAWSRERMANYKVPRLVRFFEALPVNASNKVVKGELRAAVG